jgi:hypothetical protein
LVLGRQFLVRLKHKIQFNPVKGERMSLLVLLKNRVTGQPVIADDDDNEFLNIIDCLSGTSINKSIRVRNNDNAFAVARFDQLGANKIVEFFADGVEIASMEKTGKLVSQTVVTITKSWLYTVLPAAVETVESQPRFIVPSVGLNTITRIYAVWAAGSDSGASNIFTIKRRNSAGVAQADVGTVDVNTPAQNNILNSDIADVPLTAGDQIYPLFTTRNTASEQMVTISIEIAVKLS